ncbi:MAG: carboxylesterase/lipase family protein [Butyrivibrio sp.]|nr:carboxylesterase/lipase family protein [Butyrivibrio sp.]
MSKFCCDNSTIVSTKAGKLQGYFYDGVYVFKGVHYAEADRFRQPKDVEPWEGVVDATSYGKVCNLMHQDDPRGELYVPHAYWPMDEHCQNLNIWTTDLDSSSKKPVMVWFHGGGFFAGSAIEQVAYEGDEMAKNGDVVVVNVNHRLNILGYLDLEPFGEKYKNSANCGNADLVAALKWVHENIAAFGGDPENVTIFGQSGGGMKVTSLMQTPAADGLFHKAIVMSGVLDPDFMGNGKTGGETIVGGMLEELGLTKDEVEKLETLPYPQLVEAYEKVAAGIQDPAVYKGCSPMVNDYYLGEPHITGFTEHAKTIPMMIGTVMGEFAFMPLPFNKAEVTEAEVTEKIKERFKEYADELIAEYKEAYPGKNLADIFALDCIFRTPTKKLIAEASKRSEAETYSYLFAYEFPVQNGKIAWHCSDIPFVFHNIKRVPSANVEGVSDKLEEQVFSAVMSFAKTGNPNNDKIPQWDASKENDEATLVLDKECECRHNFDNKLIALGKEAFTKYSQFDFGNVQH